MNSQHVLSSDLHFPALLLSQMLILVHSFHTLSQSLLGRYFYKVNSWQRFGFPSILLLLRTTVLWKLMCMFSPLPSPLLLSLLVFVGIGTLTQDFVHVRQELCEVTKLHPQPPVHVLSERVALWYVTWSRRFTRCLSFARPTVLQITCTKAHARQQCARVFIVTQHPSSLGIVG